MEFFAINNLTNAEMYFELWEQPFHSKRNPNNCLDNLFEQYRKKIIYMATYRDPVQCFAPLEIIERLLEIRAELGYAEVLYADNSLDLVEFLDAYGFDAYSFSSKNEKINYGDYRAQIVPGGDSVHCSLTAH